MDEEACLAASWTCCDDDVLGGFVINDCALGARELTKELLVLCGGDVFADLCSTFAFKVLGYEVLVIELEVVLDVSECGIVVAHHEVGIFADDVDLLYFLFVELVKEAVVLTL